MTNCRKFFSYAVQLAILQYLEQFHNFMLTPLNKEDKIRVLLALLVLIIIITSVICENEMESLS